MDHIVWISKFHFVGNGYASGVVRKRKEKSRPSEAPFRAALEAAWKKLDKYYNLTDKSTVYVIATMLDPRMKYKYFERNWRADWLMEVKQKMRNTFNQYRSEEHI